MILMIEVFHSSETSADFHQAARHHIPEDSSYSSLSSTATSTCPAVCVEEQV
jgi:hypothetical protein